METVIIANWRKWATIIVDEKITDENTDFLSPAAAREVQKGTQKRKKVEPIFKIIKAILYQHIFNSSNYLFSRPTKTTRKTFSAEIYLLLSFFLSKMTRTPLVKATLQRKAEVCLKFLARPLKNA